MKDSIESIWKIGFIESEPLIVPKINDLYNQKSQNIVDKLEGMFVINFGFLVASALILLVFLSYIGDPLFGIFVAAVLIGLAAYAKGGFLQLAKINKDASSYDYLKSFDHWLKASIANYTKIHRVLYPSLFLGGMWLTDIGVYLSDWMIEEFPDTPVLFGIAVMTIILTGLVATMLMYFSAAIYRMDINMVYGETFKKLDEIIADMEELRG